MTKTFGTDANNDLFIGDDGNLAVLSGLQATLNACERIAYTMLGELQFEQDRGMPNFQVVWVGAPNINQFEATLTTLLEAVPDVTRVRSLTTSVQNGVLAYTAVIDTIYGTGTFNG